MLSSSIWRHSSAGMVKVIMEKANWQARSYFEYGQQTGAQVLVYRFPNLFGKWCRPNYNSVIANFATILPMIVDYSK